MTLKISYEGPMRSSKRLRRMAVESLTRGGGRSASGLTAFFAIQHCLENNLGYVLYADPEGGYVVRLLSEVRLEEQMW